MTFFWRCMAVGAIISGFATVAAVMLNYPEYQNKLAGVVIGAPFVLAMQACFYMANLSDPDKTAEMPSWTKYTPHALILGVIGFFAVLALSMLYDVL